MCYLYRKGNKCFAFYTNYQFVEINRPITVAQFIYPEYLHKQIFEEYMAENHVGQKIAELRNQKGLTQEELAASATSMFVLSRELKGEVN